MFALEIRHKFDASHQLEDSEALVSKACARLHGHTYAVRVFIRSFKELEAGMVVDFKAVKNIIDELDHRHINEVFSLKGYAHPATAEYIAKYISDRIFEDLRLPAKVQLCEGYRGDEFSSWAIYEPQI